MSAAQPLVVSAPSYIKEFTLNLAQAAATRDVCTATGDIIVRKIGLYVVTASVGLTSVAIQTNDTTPFVVLNATDGAAANLTIGKNLPPTWPEIIPFMIRSTKKLQFTIVGTGSAGDLRCVVMYHPISAGADIA